MLLVSHANTAVDQALEDVACQLKDTHFYQDGKIIRLGVTTSKKISEEYPMLITDNIAEKLGKTLTHEKKKLEMDIEEIEKLLQSYKQHIENISKKNYLRKRKKSAEDTLKTMKDKYDIAQRTIINLQNELKSKNQDLEKAHKAGVLKRLFLGLDPLKLQQQINKIRISIDSEKNILVDIENKMKDLKEVIITCDNDLNVLEVMLYKALSNDGLTEDSITSINKRAIQKKDTINSRIAAIRKELDELQKKIIDEAKLVGTTLTKTFSSKLFPDKVFDVLIVDEASMAPLPHLFWAASKASSYFTIIGDFNQLPPICVSKTTMSQKWLGNSIFDVLNIKKVSDALIDKRVSLLDTQYRMNPMISNITNQLFYEGVLKDGYETNRLLINDELSGSSPLVLVNTSHTNPWCSQLNTGGRFNIYHAIVAASIASDVLNQKQNERIGIVTPYRAQAILIKKVVDDWGFAERVRVNTIHTFQGGEENTIIFDCVEGPGTTTWSMLDDTRKDDAHLLLNVALTRARCKVFLVASYP